MTVGFEWDTRCADLELRRLREGFTGYDHLNFGRILFENFARTQAAVHIITDSLRQSGRADVTRSGRRRWEGEIIYGGFSSGPKTPVDYAVAELYGTSPKYGGDHDYMAPTRFIDEELLGPVSSFISRGRNTPHPERGV